MSALIKETHNITPRRPRFDFSETPMHWIAGDPLASQMLNVLQPITPAPERWFCQAVREALPLIRDEKLRQAAVAFIKQEGAHSHAHTLGNRRLTELGVDVSSYEALLDWVFGRMLGSDPFGQKLKSPRLRLAWLKTRLAMVAASEHLTGVLGDWVLNAKSLEQLPVDQEMLQLYQWHGAEEVEHREVCDAVFRDISGNIFLRTTAAAFVFPLFASLAWVGVQELVSKDPQLPYQRVRIADYLRAARQGKVPAPRFLVRRALGYFSPRHSPLNEGSTEQALAYLLKMPSLIRT
ncbi:metal-dependent hydrolase [Stenotrophobium rhamnosiphilum]|uniref:Metal-dependent hydrolase n=1 Tax=Stenotrophobium rhamnosiphilum TaxID=2029166 RepID=A0A2T5MKM1_9GAMM|nr:metal-dependent hydrolase [Stenotrophobium rhamnosiphilum]PTU33122.1 metal-dependent hydrolase [Stenotrophobium rhamnosiphilum]